MTKKKKSSALSIPSTILKSLKAMSRNWRTNKNKMQNYKKKWLERLMNLNRRQPKKKLQNKDLLKKLLQKKRRKEKKPKRQRE